VTHDPSLEVTKRGKVGRVGEAGERRDAEIQRYGLLLEEPGRDLQALVELAALVCQVPTAAINLITSSRQHQIATVGFEASICVREDSMCAVVVDEPAPVVVSDARLEERFRANPFVTGAIGSVRFYASAPLRTQQGIPFGRLCVFDDHPRELDAEQVRALRSLADRVVDVLELRLRTRALEASLAELGQTRDELDRSNRRLSHFAAQVSHDLRTPLTAIMLNTEVVAQEPAVTGDDFAIRHLQAALDAGARMSRLIDEILAAQMGAALRMAPVELRSVAEAVTHDVRHLLGPGAVLEVDELPTIVGDEQHLYSVLLNLVSNALKFTRPGVAPRVRVSAERGNDRWRVVVTDNGTGLPPGDPTALFQPFVRGETDTAGSGVGLASAKRIVEMHGGHIGLGSAASGTGSSAWFEIPD
jgi:signal transduction histidine kinase